MRKTIVYLLMSLTVVVKWLLASAYTPSSMLSFTKKSTATTFIRSLSGYIFKSTSNLCAASSPVKNNQRVEKYC